MENYKQLLLGLVKYVFGYLLILLANATFALQSIIQSVLIISILYSIIGFILIKNNKYILIPIGLHFVFFVVLEIVSPVGNNNTLFLFLINLFLLPVFCFFITRFLKKKKTIIYF